MGLEYFFRFHVCHHNGIVTVQQRSKAENSEDSFESQPEDPIQRLTSQTIVLNFMSPKHC